MKTFDTVAKLKLAKLKEGQFVETGGYHAKGDGGAARYRVITEAEFAYGDKYKFDGVFHHLANGNMVEPVLKNNKLTDSQCGVFKADNTKRIENTAAWNNGSFCCKAYGWVFVTSGDIHVNNTLFIESFSQIEFNGRCTIIHDDINVNEFGLNDVLSTYPVSIYHKSSTTLTGTVILKRIRADGGLPTGNGFNIGNFASSNLSGFKCRVFDCFKAVHGQSIVEVVGGIFQANDCHTGLELLPDAGVTSEAAASTSFDFYLGCFRCVKGAVIGTTYYARVAGFVDSNKYSNPYLQTGEMPLGFWATDDCQQLDFDIGTEQCDGMLLRVDSLCNVTAKISNVSLSTDVFQTDASFVLDVPATEQGWISVGENAGLDIAQISALVEFAPVTDTYLLSLGKGAMVNINSGRFGYNVPHAKLFFVRGYINKLKIGSVKNLPQDWGSGYEYRGNNQGVFIGEAITDAGGTVNVNLGERVDTTAYTDGVTGVIRVSSIDGLYVGQKITMSSGFPAVPLTIVSIDFGTKITVDVNSNLADTGITLTAESPISTLYSDTSKMEISAISTTTGAIVGYSSLTHKSIQFNVSPAAPVAIRYSVSAYV